jgi:hypothetical protein
MSDGRVPAQVVDLLARFAGWAYDVPIDSRDRGALERALDKGANDQRQLKLAMDIVNLARACAAALDSHPDQRDHIRVDARAELADWRKRFPDAKYALWLGAWQREHAGPAPRGAPSVPAGSRASRSGERVTVEEALARRQHRLDEAREFMTDQAYHARQLASQYGWHYHHGV